VIGRKNAPALGDVPVVKREVATDNDFAMRPRKLI
jgi:hypothetical protein